MLDLLSFLIKIGLALMLFMAFLHAFVTHLIRYYEMRVDLILGERKEPIPWFKILKSMVFEGSCDFLRLFLFPFALLSYKPKAKKLQLTPILLVHGYLQNQTDWLWFRHKLQKLNDIGPIYSLNLFPPFNSISSFAEQLQHKIEAIQHETNQKNIILIGHSMGGLVCSYYNEYLAKPKEISLIITLGSPFQGTRLSALGYGKNVREMYPNSSFLNELTQKMRNSKTPYYFIASKIDNLIIPWESALPDLPFQREDNALVLEDHGHLRLLLSSKIISQVATWVKESTA